MTCSLPSILTAFGRLISPQLLAPRPQTGRESPPMIYAKSHPPATDKLPQARKSRADHLVTPSKTMIDGQPVLWCRPSLVEDLYGGGVRARRRACRLECFEATWRSGDAADCKSAYPGSIPGVASKRHCSARLPHGAKWRVEQRAQCVQKRSPGCPCSANSGARFGIRDISLAAVAARYSAVAQW